MFHLFKQMLKSKDFRKIVRQTDRFRKDKKQIKDIPVPNLQIKWKMQSRNFSSDSNTPLVLPLSQMQEGVWFDCKLFRHVTSQHTLYVWRVKVSAHYAGPPLIWTLKLELAPFLISEAQHTPRDPHVYNPISHRPSFPSPARTVVCPYPSKITA